MGEAIADFDWAAAGMPIETWPPSLRHAVSLILRAPVPMLVLWGPQWLLIYNEPYIDILGSKHPAALGRRFLDVWPQVSPAGRTILEAAFRGVPSRHEDALIRLEQDNHLVDRWFTIWQTPIVGPGASIGGVLSGCLDVTDRVRHQMALREREAHLTLALAAGRIAPWVVDFDTKRVASSPELNRMLGLPANAEPTLDELTSGYFPGELERVQRAFADAVNGGNNHFEIEYRHIRRTDGAVRWLLLRSHIERSETGDPVRTIGVVMDITDQKETEDRLRLLAKEVDHRANNLLTIITGLIRLDKAQDVSSLRSSLSGRIAALAHAHKLLSESRWTGAGLRALIQEELAPFAGADRIRVAPAEEVVLSPTVAQNLAMILHELATNAAKYGALSTPDGSITVSYGPTTADWVKLIWAETGGPSVSPPARSGVGLGVISRAMSASGEVRLEWLRRGLRCEAEFPTKGPL
jgi:PAS domain S-box-containing protein